MNKLPGISDPDRYASYFAVLFQMRQPLWIIRMKRESMDLEIHGYYRFVIFFAPEKKYLPESSFSYRNVGQLGYQQKSNLIRIKVELRGVAARPSSEGVQEGTPIINGKPCGSFEPH